MKYEEVTFYNLKLLLYHGDPLKITVLRMCALTGLPRTINHIFKKEQGGSGELPMGNIWVKSDWLVCHIILMYPMSISCFQPTVKVKLATFCLKSMLDQIMETLWLGLAEIGTERPKVLDTVGRHGWHVLTVLHRGLGQYHWSGRLGWCFPFLKIGTGIIGVLHYSASLGRFSRGSWNWCFGLFTNPLVIILECTAFMVQGLEAQSGPWV